MNLKISVILFAVATLLQLSHGIPTHRYARQATDWSAKIKEYFSKIQGYGSSESQTSPSSNQPESSTYQPGTAAGSEAGASELHSLIATKDGNPTSSGGSSAGSYIPDMQSYQNMIPNMQSYQNMIPSGMSGYYPSQMPQSMNPSGYFGSIPGSPSGAAGSAGSASEPEASIAAKEGNPTSSGGSSAGSYIPDMQSYQNMIPNMQSYQNMIPSGMSGYYPSQMPQSMNPSGYFGSIPGSPSGAAGSAGSASEPEVSIAAKEGNPTSSGGSSAGSYVPDMQSYQNMIPNMQSYQNMIPSGMSGYYPSQMPQSMNPSGYFGSKPTGS